MKSTLENKVSRLRKITEILGDMKVEAVTEDSLAKVFGLRLGSTYKVKIYRVPEDAAVDTLTEEALKLADTIEE